MQDDNIDDDNQEETAKARQPRKNALPFDEVVAMGDGLPTFKKKAWHVIGHEGGVRLAVPITTGVSRAFFYANDDYDLIPDDEAITVFQPDERKERKLGGIMARVDFELGIDSAKRALGKLIDVVKAAPAPKSSQDAAGTKGDDDDGE